MRSINNLTPYITLVAFVLAGWSTGVAITSGYTAFSINDPVHSEISFNNGEAATTDLSLFGLPGATGSIPVTSLSGLTLKGLITGNNPVALISVSNKDGVFNLGDRVLSGVVLARIEMDRVVLLRNGREEYLSMSSNPGRSEPSSPPPKINSKNVLDHLSLSMVRQSGTPIVLGLAVSPRGDGSFFRDAGFQQGDVIKSINGLPVSQVVGSMSDIPRLIERQNSTLEVIRDGSPLLINIGSN